MGNRTAVDEHLTDPVRGVGYISGQIGYLRHHSPRKSQAARDLKSICRCENRRARAESRQQARGFPRAA